MEKVIVEIRPNRYRVETKNARLAYDKSGFGWSLFKENATVFWRLSSAQKFCERMNTYPRVISDA